MNSATSDIPSRVPSFADRLMPAPVGGGFALDDHWVWGGSVIRAEDGQYHMFVSVWPRALPFMNGYVTNSRVVRAVASTPEGPYRFAQEVLPPRGSGFWDGKMTHNPEIHRIGDEYVLFYLGSTYSEPAPAAAGPIPDNIDAAGIYRRICIGVATAPSVEGPWQRFDTPILKPRPGEWDSVMVTNPTACVAPDGRIIMIYRSSADHTFAQLGVTAAEHPQGPYHRLSDDPILPGLVAQEHALEDPFIWHNGVEFELLAKDLTGAVCGEYHAVVHAVSKDARDWKILHTSQAVSRVVHWDNGSVTQQACLERTKLLFESGTPTHLFAATGNGPGGNQNCHETWNMVIPLQSQNSDP